MRHSGQPRSVVSDDTVIGWVHIVQYVRTRSTVLSAHRGTSPPFSQEQVAQIVTTVKESEPIEHDLPGYNWTMKKLRRWVKQVFGCEVSRRILSKILQEQPSELEEMPEAAQESRSRETRRLYPGVPGHL